MSDETVQSQSLNGPRAASTQAVSQQETSINAAPDNGANPEKEQNNNEKYEHPADPSRRSFLGKAGGLTAMAVAATMVPLEPLVGGKETEAEASVIVYQEGERVRDSFEYRKHTALVEEVNPGKAPDNGDKNLYTDHSGLYSKALIHDDLEIVNETSWDSFINALTSGNFNDFENILVGHPGGTNFNAELNGPQAALAFDLEGLDSHATVLPPAPTTASAQTADEQVEMYWASLLRDVNFTDYATNPVAAQAAAELNQLDFISGTADKEYPFPVTTQNLFRGQIVPGDGNVQGPYVSQFLVQPTMFGNLPLTQRFQVFLPNQDFITTVPEFKKIQNGGVPSGVLQFDPTLRFLRNGRDLTAFPHSCFPLEPYFIALLILSNINAPLNPGNPYGVRQHAGTAIGNKADHGFITLDPADCSSTMPEVANRALKAAWFHKWVVNLRQRPEEYGALVQARKTNRVPFPQSAGDLHPDVLTSQGLAQSHAKFGSFLLSQAYPEGAPPHPCYPTGHGSTGGACITALKFFFDGNQKIQPLLQAAGLDVMMASEDGTSLVPYTGPDAANLTINGELSKLAFNLSFGHGIHSGIHFRSSTNASLLLGEQVAISVLNDRAGGYNEPFDITITKLDGTLFSFNNAGNDQFAALAASDTTCALPPAP